jgi:hypothetical protein
MWRPASCHITANVVRRAEFAAANLGKRVPYLRFEPDARPSAPDTDIAHHQRALFVRTGIFIRG